MTVAIPELTGPDRDAARLVRQRVAEVIRPTGALEALDEVAVWLAGWQRTSRPAVENPRAIVFVGDHGVTVEGVSAYPATVTAAMLDALRDGDATAAAMARAIGVRLDVVDVGVGRPTNNIVEDDAMSEARFAECWQSGREAVAETSCDLLVVGEMGIGNTTAAAAVCHALFGCEAEDWTGRGTGVSDATYATKVDVVATAARRVDGSAPLEALRRVGGTELVAMAGAVIEARARSIPVVLDGFVCTAAIAALAIERPGALDHCIAGHCSREPGHRLLLEKLGLSPLIDLGLRLGEGSGALLAVPLVRLAAVAATEVATFGERGISSG